MQLFRAHLIDEMPRCIRNGIRLEVIGRRDRLDPALAAVIEEVERQTQSGRNLRLRIAVDYSARESILRAASLAIANRPVSSEQFSDLLGNGGDVDLLIRTGGEQRLSDFLLWESAYAELVFTRRMWPDFTREDLESALSEFAGRERRFGGLEYREVVPARGV
jgi:undecaprenyl diphosphate synthase